MESSMRHMLSETGRLLLERLHKQYKEHGKLVIAFDFDDTVYPYTWDLTCIIPVRYALVEAKARGHTLVCYTANDDYAKVSRYLDYHGLTPDFYNESPVASKGKIFYNIFLDDKCGLHEALTILNTFLEETK